MPGVVCCFILWNHSEIRPSNSCRHGIGSPVLDGWTSHGKHWKVAEVRWRWHGRSGYWTGQWISYVLSICLMMKARFTLMKGQNENQGKKTNKFRKMHETMQKLMLLSFSWCESCLDKLLFHGSAGKLVQCWFRQGIVPRAKTPGYESFPARYSPVSAVLPHQRLGRYDAWWCLMISGQIPIIR